MANVTHVFRITTSDSAAQLSEYLDASPGDGTVILRRLRKFLNALANGNATAGTVSIASSLGNTADVKASATAACASVIATDTLVVNGVTFTAVNSGATGNQWNKGSSNTECATNLAAAINASVTAKVANYLTASSSSGTVTLTARQPGLAGNMFTITSTGGTITCSGSGFFTNGAGGDVALTTVSVS